MPIYEYNGEKYNIPEEVEEQFIADVPDAKKLVEPKLPTIGAYRPSFAPKVEVTPVPMRPEGRADRIQREGEERNAFSRAGASISLELGRVPFHTVDADAVAERLRQSREAAPEVTFGFREQPFTYKSRAERAAKQRMQNVKAQDDARDYIAETMGIKKDDITDIGEYTQEGGEYYADFSRAEEKRMNKELDDALTKLGDALYQQVGASLQEKMNKINPYKDITENFLRGIGTTQWGAPQNRSSYMPGIDDEQTAVAYAAARALSLAKGMQEAAHDDGMWGNFLEGALSGLAEAGENMTDAKKMNDAIATVVKKWEDGGETTKLLNDDEKMLLDALAYQTAVASMYQDKISTSYNVGSTVGAMLPFAVEFLVNPASGLGRKAASQFGKYALKRFAKNTANKYARSAIYNTGRGLGRIGGSVAGGAAMTVTTGLPKTVVGVQERMLGRPDVDYADGKPVYAGQIDREEFIPAVKKEVAKQMLEYGSEMLGAGYLDDMFTGVNKLFKGTKLQNWIGKITSGRRAQSVKKFMERTGWNGPAEEFLEEVHVGLLEPYLVGDNTHEDFFNKDNLIEVALGVAIPGVVVSTAKTVAGAADGSFRAGAQERWKMEHADRRATELWGNWAEWKDLRNSLMVSQPEEIEAKLKEIANSTRLTAEQKMAAIDFGIYSLQYRTARGVADAMTDGRRKEINSMLHELYYSREANKEQGYSQEPTGVNSIVALTEYEAAENEVRRVLGLAPDDDIENVVAQMGELTDDAADALEDYRRKKAVFDGLKQKFRDTVTKQYAEAENSIDRMVNKDNPSMVYSTMLDGQMVYITGGNVVLREDNTIDIDQSSDLYVTYPNNQVKPVSANRFASPVKVESAEALKAARKAEIDAQWQSEFDSAEISAEEQQKREKGVVFDMTDPEGTHRVEIVSEGEDMSKVLIDGNPTEIPTTLLNKFREEAGIQTESGEVKGENGNVQTESAVADDATDNVAPTGDNVAPVAPKTALEQIPRNEKNVPLYEQVDSELAWDGVVEEAGGNEETAMVAVNSMIEDKKKALAAAEKAKAKAGATIAEKIAAEKERKAAIDAAQQELNIWKKIAGTANRRRMDAEAERKRIADEAAALRKAEEERLRAEREEAERIEREALNGVPDIVDDTPQDAEQSGTQATSSMNAPTTSSASEDRNSVSNSQENAQKSGEITENGGEKKSSIIEEAEAEYRNNPLHGVQFSIDADAYNNEDVTFGEREQSTEGGALVNYQDVIYKGQTIGWVKETQSGRMFAPMVTSFYVPLENATEEDKRSPHYFEGEEDYMRFATLQQMVDYINSRPQQGEIQEPRSVEENLENDEKGQKAVEPVEENKPKVRGRKQVEKAVEKMRKADAEGNALEVLNNIQTAELNAKRGDEGAITLEEQAEIDALKKKYAEMGYEVVDPTGMEYDVEIGNLAESEQAKIGQKYILGDADFQVHNEGDKLVVKSVVKHGIIKDGVIVQTAKVLIGPEGTSNDIFANMEKSRTEDSVSVDNQGNPVEQTSNINQLKTFDRTPPKNIGDAKSRILEIIEIAKKIKDKVYRTVVGSITSRQKEDFKREGLSVDESWVHSFENSRVIHENSHMAAEKRKEQIPVSEEELLLIPDILENYDYLQKSPNKNKEGNAVVIYKKQYPDGTIYYLEEVRTRRKSLAFQSMYKKRSDSSDGLLNNGSTPSTSQTPSDNFASASEGTTQSAKVQENTKKSGETAEHESGKMYSPEELAEAFDNFFATVEEKTEDGQTVLFQQGMIELDRENPAFERATENVRKKLEATGAKVKVLTKEEAESELARIENAQRQVVNSRMSKLDKVSRAIMNWLKNNTRNKRFEIELPAATQRKIRKEMGRDFDTHSITANSVAHSKKNHGVGGEKNTTTSIPLRDEDFALIPYIMTAPDNVIRGSYSTDGSESVRFYKNLSNGYVVVVEKEQKNSPDDMETITMWAELSANVPNARNMRPSSTTSVTVTISPDDVAKIRKDAENAILFDTKVEKMVYGGNSNQEIFVSNAQRAVEGIKQEKATPEQWIAMLKKNGGLKAGEETWLGLEEWLNEKQGAVTKHEILDFIGENKIQIEEVEYRDDASDNYTGTTGFLRAVEEQLEEDARYHAESEVYPDEFDTEEDYLYAIRSAIREYKEDPTGVHYDIAAEKVARRGDRPNLINSTRLDYTTVGLENKREIALVVPTIEPYNESDEVHFGDAGNGRAVAWVRFGETTDSEGNRVLVIDEIQSKRHQDGREKGYRGVGLAKEVLAAEEEVRKTNRELTAYRESLKEKYNFKELGGSMFERLKNFDAMLSEEERITMDALGQARNKAEKRLQELRGQERGIPSAPFEKNWQELAMKRMLRLAAEEGFDKVAWTTGEQQAERYNIAKVVSHIECEKVGKNGNKSFSMGLDYKFIVDPNGIVVSSKDEYIGKSIADIVGKPLANKMLEMQEGDTISGDGLRIGGEGMKGFYDRMLPSFVSKYTKRWGAKVGTVEMPSLEQNNVMHSVDVTPEMKESVMEGQTMFLRTPDGVTYGWVVNGEIYLTPEGLNPNTPIHEYTHLWAAALQKSNPKLWNEVVEAMKLSPVWNEVMADENYTDIHGDENRVASEVLSRLSGNEGYRRYMEQAEKEIAAERDIVGKVQKKGILNRIKNAVSRFWNWLKGKFGSKAKAGDGTEAKAEPWDVFVNKSLKDFDEGVNPDAKDSPLEKMAAGENSSNTQEGETRFSKVEETTEGSIDDVTAQPLTLMERITNSLLEVSAKNKENFALRADALKAFGKDITRVLSIMKVQKEYDKSTVNQLVKLAKMYFKNAQLLGEVDTYTMGRVLSLINNVVGKEDVTASAAKLMDILLDAHTKALAGILDKAEKVKAKKVNAAGVEVMGRLDKYGQKRVEEYRAAKEMTPEKLEEAIYDSDNRLAELEQRVREELGLPEGDVDQAAREYTGDNDVVNVYMDERARLEGLTLAREYKESIQQVQEEIKDLERDLKQAKEDYRLGNIDGKSLKEFRKSVAEAIMESKAGLIEGYHSLIYKFQENTKESSKKAKAFALAQIDRAREIQHNANSDMEGISAATQGTHPDNHNNAVMNALRSPFPTLQGMLKKFGEKNVDGRGYLYERFIPQATKAGDNEFRGKVAARVMIEGKLKEIYGKKMTIAKSMKQLREYGATVTYREGNEMKQFDLTKGQMLYIYMVNKMADGQIKLRRMGITDDVVAELMTKLPEEAVQFADWAQNELLKILRGKYNAVHERVFGAPMAAIENYFPIKIRKEARGEKGDVSEVGQEGKPSTVTGSIIKRTKNATAIDLSADAMQVLMEHIDDMEHWAAFAEFNRDLNVLLNYKHFQNQVKNMTSVRYGSGEEIWKNFKKTAQIVSGTYRPSDSSIDRAVQNIAKGLTRSKINFRLYTAIKQLLSAPAFWTDAGVKELAYCYANPKGSLKWAKENLPGFAERWQGRTMGNEKLLKSDSDWEVWRNEFVENATRWGMTPNAAIDALTVAQGARAVYMTKLEQFKKAGYTELRANEKALQAAAEAYNESQQSSEGTYLSPLQVEGTVASAIFSTFKNSNFGYTRKTAQAVANIKRKMRKGYKEETIAFMTKQMMRDGLSEENAKKMAEKVYNRSKYKDVANVAMFGFGLNLLWEAGGKAIYLLLGDDDEEKEKMMEEIAFRGSLGLLNGIPFGETMISAAMAVKEGDTKYFRLPQLIAVGDIENLAQVLNYDPVRGANDIVNMFTSMGVGVSPQVLTDILVAFGDVEGFSAEELGMLVARFVNAPQSNLDRLMVDDAMENSAINAEEIMQRYAEYKKSKNAPITQFLYSDEEEQKAVERYGKRFAKLLDERLENVVEDNDAYDLFYENADVKMKSKLAKMRQKYLAGDKAKDFEKLDAKELVERVLYGSGEINETYYNLSTAEDEDAALAIKFELKKHEDIYNKGKDLMGEEWQNFEKANGKEYYLYEDLKKIERDISKEKTYMKKHPEKADESMEYIREQRAEAIKLINDYNNE